MSTDRIHIVHGDGKFELVAQMMDCVRGITWKKRTPFVLTLSGRWEDFIGGSSDSVPSTIDIGVFFTGFKSQGREGSEWFLTGALCHDEFEGKTHNERAVLRRFQYFNSLYNVRTRDGYVTVR